MKVRINDKTYLGRPGQTILELAQENGLKIPSLCHHPDLSVKANCRVCVVEIKGRERLATSCSTPVSEGMEIYTNSIRVKRAREMNLELLFAEHIEKCGDCTLQYDCTLLDLARRYKIKINRFLDRKGKRPTYRFANAVEIDGTQCIDCQNCVEACQRQGIGYLKIEGHGANQEIKPVKDKKTACIYCGQCANVCPVAAAQEQSCFKEVEAALRDKNKIVVAQFAPAVRVAIGEEFSLPAGTNCEGKIYTALRKLGFKQAFDVNFAADVTTMAEAEELMERLGNKKAVWPMMTSCCPAWVAYAEYYHPELLPNLTTVRSPQIIQAGAIKTYWAQKKKLAAKNIVVVSIMPCTSKKYEAARPELTLNGRPLVDYVLTTRELAFLIKKNKLDFKKLPDGRGEPLFNEGSGAAAIYGASGGVMESALRTAVDLAGVLKQGSKAKAKALASRLEFKEVRGLAGFKEATLDVAGRRLKIGIVNGIGNFHRVLPKLSKYHYIEVMACPGGCLGGGGQPLPTTDAIRAKRMAGLYGLDKQRVIRRAHENQAMVEYYDWVKKNKLSAQVIHTKFKKSSGSILTTAKKSQPRILNLF
ncbi:MAG: [FeFe] hydrogenase, group A [Patescibacteria group bacterium]|jgi:NADH-quinone oxidoreductase subunit G/NADP-reducing hydrogenase subunit HndD